MIAVVIFKTYVLESEAFPDWIWERNRFCSDYNLWLYFKKIKKIAQVNGALRYAGNA